MSKPREASDAEASERMRLEGNAAFQNKDFESAVDLYRRANQYKEDAKIYANLAAALCKLDRLDEAKTAAERGIVIDPKWTKAWWRLGTIAEELQDYILALSCFCTAAELSPRDVGCKKSLRIILEKLGLQETNPGGHPIMVNMPGLWLGFGYMAWVEAFTLVGGGSTFRVVEKYKAHPRVVQQIGHPTSRQYLVQGMAEWVNGLKRAVASLSISLYPRAEAAFLALQARRATFVNDEAFELECDNLLGGVPESALESLVDGYSRLCGAYVFLEGVNPGEPAPRFGTAGHFLRTIGNYQSLAILWVIETSLTQLVRRPNFNSPRFKCSKAILEASGAIWASLSPGGANRPNLEINRQQAPFPEDIVKYIKDQLEAGTTWEGGLRDYFALQYRGTVLFAAFQGLRGQLAQSYEYLKWARKLVTLADDEFSVSQTSAYAIHGTAFQLGLRVGVFASELSTHSKLRGDGLDGPYDVAEGFDMCIRILNLVHNIKKADLERDGPEPNEYSYTDALANVSCVRKPLALAHSIIAPHLSAMRQSVPASFFTEKVHSMGFFQGALEDGCDPFQVIATHYRSAAENELPDYDQAAIYWWAYCSMISQANESSRFTLKDLVHAVSMAERAEQSRDVGLFGLNHQKGGSYEAIAKLTLQHFKDESDTFVLPQVLLVKRADGITSLRLEDGTVVCEDFSDYEKIDTAYYHHD